VIDHVHKDKTGMLVALCVTETNRNIFVGHRAKLSILQKILY